MSWRESLLGGNGKHGLISYFSLGVMAAPLLSIDLLEAGCTFVINTDKNDA